MTNHKQLERDVQAAMQLATQTGKAQKLRPSDTCHADISYQDGTYTLWMKARRRGETSSSSRNPLEPVTLRACGLAYKQADTTAPIAYVDKYEYVVERTWTWRTNDG